MSEISEHEFVVTVDVVQLDRESDRVVINGYLGEVLEAKFHGNRLEIMGDEASISIQIIPEEIKTILESIAI
jgi:hypothetical protein